MPWILQYFWFVCAAFMLLNVFIWKRRLAVVVERGNATKAEMDQFIRWASLGLVGGPVLLGVIGLVAGWSSPFCAGIMQFTDVSRTLVSLLTLGSWIALLWWVWRGNGADFLARVAPALGQRPAYDTSYSPRTVRLIVTAIVLIGGAGSVLSWRTMPMPPEMGFRVAVSAHRHTEHAP